jgi:hypothetical protein
LVWTYFTNAAASSFLFVCTHVGGEKAVEVISTKDLDYHREMGGMCITEDWQSCKAGFPEGR